MFDKQKVWKKSALFVFFVYFLRKSAFLFGRLTKKYYLCRGFSQKRIKISLYSLVKRGWKGLCVSILWIAL